MKTLFATLIMFFALQQSATEKLFFDGAPVNDEKVTLSTIPTTLEIKEVNGSPTVTIFHTRSGKLMNEIVEVSFPKVIELDQYNLMSGDILIIAFDRGSENSITYQVKL